MAKRQLSVKTGVKLDDIAKVTKELQGQLSKVSSSLKIEISQVNFGNMNKAISELDKKLDSINKVNLTSSFKEQSNTVAKIKGDYEDILQSMKSLKTEIMMTDGKMAKLDFNTDKKGEVTSGKLTYQYDEARKAVEKYGWTTKKVNGEVVQIFEKMGTSFSENIEKQDNTRQKELLEKQKNAYSEILKYQKEEFQVKNKLLTAEGGYREELERTLVTIQKTKQEKENNVSKGNDLFNIELENKLLKEREDLARKYNLEQARVNTNINKKTTKELEIQNRYLDQQISKLKLYQQSVKNRGGQQPTKQADISAELNKQIAKLNELKNANVTLGQIEKTRINETINSLKLQTNELVRYQSNFTNIFKKMSNYALGGSIIYGGMNQLRQGITNVVELDSCMRDLRKVAKATDDQLKDFTTTANEMAIGVGRTTESAIKATEYYSKLGYSIEEASERAKNAMIFANVSDMDIESASKALITMQKGYGMDSVEDTMRIMDGLNEVGNNFSSTTEGIAEGLRRSSSSLREANNSFEQSVGLFVAANSAVQDPESVGTALKTLSLRLRGMKTDLEDTDVPLSKLREELIAIAKVDIMQADGTTFKSTYDIMLELSKVYPKLTESQQAWITQQVAGTRQANVMGSLLFNMSDGVKAYETALNSSGSAMKENERFMDSVQGKINEFTETLKKVWIDAISTDSIKGILDVGTGLLNILDSLINTFGLIPTTVGIATLALKTFNNEMFIGMTQNIPIVGSLNTKIDALGTRIQNSIGDKVINAFIAYSNSMKTAKASATVLQAGNVALSASLKMVEIGAALAGAAMTLGLSIAITAAFTGLSKLIDNLVLTKKELQEMNKEFLSDGKGIEKKISNVDDLIKKYEQLKGVTENPSSTSDEVAKADNELLEVQKKLAEIYPQVVTEIDKNGEAKKVNLGLTKQLVEAEKTKQLSESLSIINENDKLNTLNKLSVASYEYKKAIDQQTEANRYLKAGQKEVTKEIEYYSNGVKNTKQVTIDMVEQQKKANKSILEQQESMRAVQYAYQIANEHTNQYTEHIDILNDAFSYVPENADDATNSVDNFGNVVSNAGDKTKETTDKINGLNDAFTGTSNELEFVNKVIEEYNKNHSLSANTVSQMAKDYQHLLPFLENEATMVGKLTQQRDLLKVKQNEQYNALISAAVSANNAEMQSAATTQNFIADSGVDTVNYLQQTYGIDVSNFTKAQQEKVRVAADAGNSIAQLLGQIGQGVIGGLGGGYKGVTITPPKLNPPALSDGSSGGKGGSSKKDKEKEIKDLELKLNRYRDLENAIDKINDQIEQNEVLMKNASDEDKIKFLKEQNSLYEQQRQALIKLKNEQLKEQAEERNKLINNGFTFNGDELVGATERLKQLQNWANGLSGKAKEDAQEKVKELEEIVKNYDSLTRDKLPDSLKQIQEINNSIIDSQKEIANILAKQRDEFIKKEQEKTDALKKAINERKDLMNKQWEEEDREDKRAEEESKLNELQNQLAIAMRTGNEEYIKSIQRQIEEQRKSLNDLINEQEKDIANDRFDEELDNLDEDLENKIDEINKQLSDDEILKLVQKGVYDLNEVLGEIGNSTNDVSRAFVGVGTIIQDEWLGALDLFNRELDKLNKVDIDIDINTTQKAKGNANGKVEIKVENNIEIKGEASRETINNLQDVMEDFKDDLLKEIAETLGGR